MVSPEKANELRRAFRLVSIAVHPDTGEVIPWLLSMRSFVPVELFMTYGMIVAKPTPFNTIFWQWLNQTYGCAITYGNRNASSNYTNGDILRSYAVAAIAGPAISLLIRKRFEARALKDSGSRLIFYNSWSTFVACSAAGFLNTIVMR